MFLRDAKNAEVLLSQQENYLTLTEDVPSSLEEAENALKRHQDFLITMGVNGEKIKKGVVMCGVQLCDGHCSADNHKKARNMQKKRDAKREKVVSVLDRLQDALALH